MRRLAQTLLDEPVFLDVDTYCGAHEAAPSLETQSVSRVLYRSAVHLRSGALSLCRMGPEAFENLLISLVALLRGSDLC